MQAVRQALSCITLSLMQQQHNWLLSLRFGPSPLRPHETYDFLFRTAGDCEFCCTPLKSKGCSYRLCTSQHNIISGDMANAESSAATDTGLLSPTPNAHQKIARRVIRGLIMSEAEVPEGKANRGQQLHCFSLVQAYRDTCICCGHVQRHFKGVKMTNSEVGL